MSYLGYANPFYRFGRIIYLKFTPGQVEPTASILYQRLVVSEYAYPFCICLPGECTAGVSASPDG